MTEVCLSFCYIKKKKKKFISTFVAEMESFSPDWLMSKTKPPERFIILRGPFIPPHYGNTKGKPLQKPS